LEFSCGLRGLDRGFIRFNGIRIVTKWASALNEASRHNLLGQCTDDFAWRLSCVNFVNFRLVWVFVVKEFASAAALLCIKPAQMKTSRLEAFSDGVLAIIITIMVLELKVPHAVDLAALKPLLPVLLSYVLSFIYVGIFWNNHHHLFQATEQVSGGILWANLHLLFWLSLFPFTTGWMGENGLAAIPTAVYGFVLLMAAIAYQILEHTIIGKEGRDSLLARAVGRDWKGKLSPVLYFVAIPLAFVSPWIASGIYVVAALLWLIPDPRIERKLEKREP
jgi:uncharacterized membrane protein